MLIAVVCSRAAGGLVDADSDYQKTLAQEVAKLQRLYGGGDLTSFPEFKFTGESTRVFVKWFSVECLKTRGG